MRADLPDLRSSSSAARSRARVLGALALPGLLAAGCAAVDALAPVAASIGKELLLTASENYSEAYSESIEEMFGILVKTLDAEGGDAEAPVEETLRLDVALLKLESAHGRSTLVEIQDGDVLHDGNGDPSSGERFKITFQADQSCWIYVIAIDATGWVTPVFPGGESSATNPVTAGRVYQFPGEGRWYALDEHRGVENVYFLASREPRPDLERILERFTGTRRPPRAEYRAVGEAAVATRGVAAVQPGRSTRVRGDAGEPHEVTLTAVLGEIEGGLVLTRWFHHR